MYLLLGKIVAVKKPFQLKNKTSVFSKKPYQHMLKWSADNMYLKKFEKSSSAGLPANIASYYKLRVTVWLLQSSDCDDRDPMMNFIT